MLQANVPADPNRHIPPEIEMSSIGKLTKSFKTQYGTFSDQEDEDIVIFARNADEFMRRNLTPSLEMGWIIIYNLKGEPYMRAMRWRNSMDFDPERIHADHWSHQPHQAATPLLPYIPMQRAQPLIAQRPAGIGLDGQPDTKDPDHPGRIALPFTPMRPSIPTMREQPAVNANHCLKAYLLHTFRKRIVITTAKENLTTLISKKPKQTYGSKKHT